VRFANLGYCAINSLAVRFVLFVQYNVHHATVQEFNRQVFDTIAIAIITRFNEY